MNNEPNKTLKQITGHGHSKKFMFFFLFFV